MIITKYKTKMSTKISIHLQNHLMVNRTLTISLISEMELSNLEIQDRWSSKIPRFRDGIATIALIEDRVGCPKELEILILKNNHGRFDFNKDTMSKRYLFRNRLKNNTNQNKWLL